jgi:sugar phosphate isomerase/epimerase
MHRRRWMKGAAAGLVAGPGMLAASPAVSSAEDHPRVRPHILYALSTGSWNVVVKRGAPLPLLQILDETAAAGFNGVRLTGYPSILEQNRLTEAQLGDELAKRGLKFSTISFGGPYDDRARQSEILDRARQALALHKRLGATAAVFFPPRPAPKAEEIAALAESCKFFDRMGKMAIEEFGVRMGLHNHTDSLIERPDQVNYFLEHTDPHFVFCAWDTAHLFLGGCDVVETFRRSLDRIVYTDFKDATRSPANTDYVAPNGARYAADSHLGRFYNSVFELGRGEIDFPALMRMLKSVDYSGWINHDLDTIRESCPASWQIAMRYIVDKLDPIYE